MNDNTIPEKGNLVKSVDLILASSIRVQRQLTTLDDLLAAGHC